MAPPGRHGISQGTTGDLVLSRIGRDVDVAGMQVFHELGQAQIPVHEANVIADAQRLGHPGQGLPVDFSLPALHLRMCGPHDQVQNLRVGGHDPGHGLDHVFQPLPAVDETESTEHSPAHEAQTCLVSLALVPGNLRYAVGNHLHVADPARRTCLSRAWKQPSSSPPCPGYGLPASGSGAVAAASAGS